VVIAVFRTLLNSMFWYVCLKRLVKCYVWMFYTVGSSRNAI
jgi:hypothetical protein